MSKPVQISDYLAESSQYLCKELIWDKVLDLTIDRVEGGHNVPVPGTSKKDKCIVLFFDGAAKGHVLNRGRAKFLARKFGNNTATWKGKRVTLYVSMKNKKNPDQSTGRIDIAVGNEYCYEAPPARKQRPASQQQQRPAPTDDVPTQDAPPPDEADYPEAQ